MKTKSLSLEQMENLEGGWSWGSCAGGALAVVATGMFFYAGAVAGPIGMLGSLAAGCVASNLV